MRRTLLVVLALVAASAALGGWRVLTADETGELERTAEEYLSAWRRSDWPAMRRLAAAPGPRFARAHAQMLANLDVESARFRLASVERNDDRGEATFHARLRVGGLGTWAYEGRLKLVRLDGRWRVAWSPSTLHPALLPGRSLERTRSWPRRAPILAEDATPLAADREVIVVGVEPRRVEDRRQLLVGLERYAGVDRGDVVKELTRPGVQPDWFIPVADLRPDTYARVRPQLHPIPGTVFRRSTGRLAPTDGFASHVLGVVGDVTAELLDKLGEPYTIGDRVGLSGLERVYERRLAGEPRGQIRVVDARGRVVAVVRRFRGRKPRPVRTTLSLAVQAAAERALDGVEKPAAIVALDANSGELRAVASRPRESFDRALAGRYPPGSTFKIVTTAALLERGITPEDVVPCPQTVTVGGKAFRNAERAALGSISFRTAFAQSCNTAFVQLAARLDAATLTREAREFGFGARYTLPLDVAGGRFPRPRDLAELAAAALGQGRVEASPAHMATVAAAGA
ncbi:MAG: penicillin-binding transpeptidase domain-containing protein, partial [Actinomycetota bacterium]|nr:penicillin-binding transpeptidase domain-containing protein [Actinomycetota bacterium]